MERLIRPGGSELAEFQPNALGLAIGCIKKPLIYGILVALEDGLSRPSNPPVTGANAWSWKGRVLT
jgi:hypothetical protein